MDVPKAAPSPPLLTVEVRWFFAGVLPVGVRAWFGPARSTPEAPAWRTDVYVRLPGITDLGIKAREGRFEIKGRTEDLGLITPAPGIEGRLERWAKWSYGDAGVVATTAPWFGAADGALKVEKRRTLRRIDLPRRSEAEAARSGTDGNGARRAVAFELTEIRFRTEAFWSLGCEASPDDPELPKDLRRTLPDLLDRWPGPPLAAVRSLSYPAWLSALTTTP